MRGEQQRVLPSTKAELESARLPGLYSQSYPGLSYLLSTSQAEFEGARLPDLHSQFYPGLSYLHPTRNAELYSQSYPGISYLHSTRKAELYSLRNTDNHFDRDHLDVDPTSIHANSSTTTAHHLLRQHDHSMPTFVDPGTSSSTTTD
jgi:hypothetical protein